MRHALVRQIVISVSYKIMSEVEHIYLTFSLEKLAQKVARKEKEKSMYSVGCAGIPHLLCPLRD